MRAKATAARRRVIGACAPSPRLSFGPDGSTAQPIGPRARHRRAASGGRVRNDTSVWALKG
eukprot:1468603-Prymnesium_polylepis.2